MPQLHEIFVSVVESAHTNIAVSILQFIAENLESLIKNNVYFQIFKITKIVRMNIKNLCS